MKLCIEGLWQLVDRAGNVVAIGQQTATFRGDLCEITGGKPPRDSGSTGRIYTSAGEFFPSVCDMQWVEKPEAPNSAATTAAPCEN